MRLERRASLGDQYAHGNRARNIIEHALEEGLWIFRRLVYLVDRIDEQQRRLHIRPRERRRQLLLEQRPQLRHRQLHRRGAR